MPQTGRPRPASGARPALGFLRSPPEQRRPVDGDTDRVRVRGRHVHDHQEPLPIGRHVVVLPAGRIHAKERPRRSHSHAGAGFDVRRDHLVASGNEVELATVPSPTRSRSARHRYAHSLSRLRKGSDVHLGSAGLGRAIGDPAAVRRELSLEIGGLRGRHEPARLRLALYAEDPKTATRLGLRGEVEDGASVGRPVVRPLDSPRRENGFRSARPSQGQRVE